MEIASVRLERQHQHSIRIAAFGVAGYLLPEAAIMGCVSGFFCNFTCYSASGDDADVCASA